MPSISTFPTEIQKLILPHLDWKTLNNLRASKIYYRDIITNGTCWKTHHDERWPNGKRRYTRCWSHIEDWSRLHGWKTHPAQLMMVDTGGDNDGGNGNTNYFVEFMRRSRLDHTVVTKLMELDVEQSQSNEVWYTLMSDGEDIIDCLNNIISQKKSSLHVVAAKVLNGISRCVAYQEWKFLHNAVVLPQTRIEDGAIAIEKFYEKHDTIMTAKCIHSWEAYVLHELEQFADIVKKRLDNTRSCVGDVLPEDSITGYPILEVIEVMKYLFRVPGQLDDDPTVPYFSGNVGDYYNHTNSLIKDCLERKTGIPITLAVIYAAIVRRVCGVQMDIIGLPGHIVVGVPPSGGDFISRIFVDPFQEGRILNLADCQAIVERYNITFNDDMVRPISNEQVWQRIIRNLIHSHSQQALADDNDNGHYYGSESSTQHEWKIAIPLRFLLSDYAPRITNFRELVAAPGWCPQFF